MRDRAHRFGSLARDMRPVHMKNHVVIGLICIWVILCVPRRCILVQQNNRWYRRHPPWTHNISVGTVWEPALPPTVRHNLTMPHCWLATSEFQRTPGQEVNYRVIAWCIVQKEEARAWLLSLIINRYTQQHVSCFTVIHAGSNQHNKCRR
jgi:hypothetical protein